jgi:hypothetical protein
MTAPSNLGAGMFLIAAGGPLRNAITLMFLGELRADRRSSPASLPVDMGRFPSEASKRELPKISAALVHGYDLLLAERGRSQPPTSDDLCAF